MKPVYSGEIAVGTDESPAIVPQGLQLCFFWTPVVFLPDKGQRQLGVQPYLLGTTCLAAVE